MAFRSFGSVKSTTVAEVSAGRLSAKAVDGACAFLVEGAFWVVFGSLFFSSVSAGRMGSTAEQQAGVGGLDALPMPEPATDDLTVRSIQKAKAETHTPWQWRVS
jgi:hypothetical protein